MTTSRTDTERQYHRDRPPHEMPDPPLRVCEDCPTQRCDDCIVAAAPEHFRAIEKRDRAKVWWTAFWTFVAVAVVSVLSIFGYRLYEATIGTHQTVTSHNAGIATTATDTQKIVQADKELAAFATWLIEATYVNHQCSATPTNCPPLPPLPSLPGVNK